MPKSGRNGRVIMRIRNANAGEMVTNVPPTVEALNGGEKKGGGGHKHCVGG